MELPFGKREQIVRKHARHEMMWVIQGGGWIGVCKSADPLWFINQIRPYIKFSPWIRNPGKKNFITQKVQNPGPKKDKSANRCFCRIRKSVKISPLFRNFQNPPIRWPINPPLPPPPLTGKMPEGLIWECVLSHFVIIVALCNTCRTL